MFDFLIAPENLPFAVALVLMLMIGAVEAFGLGASAAHLDMDSHADGGDLLGWLGIGQVPLLVTLVVLLALFGMIGIGVQQFAQALLGAPLSPWLASAAAFIGALPLLGVATSTIARIMPGDETTAVSLDSLVGKRAQITVGSARRGCPAQARVRDTHGQAHYVMVEPNSDDQAVGTGETVLLVRREGGIFIGLAEGDALLPRLDEPLRS